jgi:predicted Zn-dependent peptidase
MVSDPAYREFYTERSVILEERRGGVDNDPDGKMSEILVESAFKNGPYHWPVIGSVKDVAGLTMADAKAFHDRFYVANNMVGVLVGDIDLGEAKKLISKYFSGIPSSAELPKEKNYANKGGVKEEFSFNAEPAVAMAYHKPTLPDPTEFVFDVINVLLCDGPTSRLEKRLIYDERIASDVSCSDSYPGSRLNNLMLIWMEPNRGHTNEELVAEVGQELDRLKREPISDEELERVRTRVKADMLYGLEKNMGLALSLAEFETVFGDWRLLAKYPKLVDAVSKEDIMRIANEYFEPGDLVEVLRVRGTKKK